MGKSKRVVIIGPRTRRNFLFLYKLLETKSAKQRWGMIQNCNRDELLALIDVCTNIKRSSFRLTAKQRRRIDKHTALLERLGRVRSEDSAKRLIQVGEGIVFNPKAKRKRDRFRISQRGGVIPAVLAPVLIELAAEALEHVIPDPPENYMVCF